MIWLPVALIAAVLLVRRAGQGAGSDAYSDQASTTEEPDQTATTLETIKVTIDPSTYTAPDVAEDRAAANRAAFLAAIAYSEGTAGPNGYRTMFGGGLFDSFADHPRVFFPYTDKAGKTIKTSAAGRYQITATTWNTLQPRLGLEDFSPESQDAAALELIREQGALNDVDAGNFETAVSKVRRIWASLPGSGWNQPERSIDQLKIAYERAGGAYA